MMSPGNIFAISLELKYHLIGSENMCGSNFKSDKICINVFYLSMDSHYKLTLDHARICVVNKTFWRGTFQPLGET